MMGIGASGADVVLSLAVTLCCYACGFAVYIAGGEGFCGVE